MLNNTIDKTVEILQVLTDKLSGINDKAKENTLLNQEYEELNNKLNTLSAMFSSDTNESDIVSLLNLPRPISEYTNDHIGETILIPYTDESENISLNNGCIEFEVVGVNHHTSDEHQQTITLMAKNIIRYAAFDAKEPNNPLFDEIYEGNARAGSGNNRWSVSNIRQWLNSNGAANVWFTALHDYDEAPTTDKVSNEAGAYADNPGFLAGFSADVLQHFTDITNTTAVANADGGGVETTVDKVFLASYTEMGFGNNNEIAEGRHLDQKFIDNNSKIKSETNNTSYWMRSPTISDSYSVRTIDLNGLSNFNPAFFTKGVVPLVVLH